MNQETNIKNVKEAAPQSVVNASNIEHADLGTEVLENRVNEVAKTSKDVQGDSSSGGQQQDDGQTQQAQDQSFKDEREVLKQRLLKSAPKESAMRDEIEKLLIKKKESLETEISQHRRKKNYHLLSLAVMQLRAVVHQLEVVAKASYDTLKGIWLKVVHKFA